MFIGLSFAQAPRAAVNREAMPAQKSSIAQRVATLRKVSEVLRQTAALPMPRGLAPAETTEAQGYDVWLKTSVGRLDALAAKGESIIGGSAGSGGAIGSAAGSGDSQANLLQATKNMQEMQMSFNLQYLQLQNQLQNENRRFTMVSNIMKSKHDTVKNSINNIR
jgi:hypothetical protein